MDILDQILNAQRQSRKDDIETFKSIFAEVKQDPEIKDKKGTQPAKYYAGDMSKSTKDKRAAHFKKGKEGPAPGDATAKTKKSVHTKKAEKMFGENVEGLKKKAEKSGMPLSILKKVYNRGLAAYKGGHRPGATAPQWAMARVNSFITKSKGTWGKADADLAKQVRGESLEEDNVAVQKAQKKAQQTDEMERLKLKHERELENMKDRHERENERLDRAKEKETQDVAIQKKREADRKKNEEVELEEGGKSRAQQAAIAISKKEKAGKPGYDKHGKSLKNKQEGLWDNIRAKKARGEKMRKKGAKGAPTDDQIKRAQGEEIEENRDQILKKIKNIKGISKKQIQVISTMPTPVLTTLINQLSVLVMSESVDEGKLVASIEEIIDSVMKKIKSQVGREIRKNQEKGIGMLNTLGSFVGAKVTDKKQAKGKLFLKFGDTLDEGDCGTKSKRNYKKEYENYHSSPEQIRRRAKRNEARRILKNRKGIKGKDVHHKDNNPMNNDKSNLSIVSQNYNRKEPRLREKGEK